MNDTRLSLSGPTFRTSDRRRLFGLAGRTQRRLSPCLSAKRKRRQQRSHFQGPGRQEFRDGEPSGALSASGSAMPCLLMAVVGPPGLGKD
ncbi:hypothetical protein MJO29_008963 [Puccinia striiformis f. sp. tritici]|nr:hypothetical protein MJO29_008963 [Puccinia striiformis f. sp. tritici]